MFLKLKKIISNDMNINRFKRLLSVGLTIMSAAMFIQSCGGSDDNAAMIAELQKQLDATMVKYEQVKEENAGFEGQMASRDSAIKAQAAEIQNLINQLNAQKGKRATASTDNGRAEKLQKELKEKENTIKKLQKELDKQADALGSNDVKESKVAQLQRRINEQEDVIGNLRKELQDNEKEIASLRSGASDCDGIRSTYQKNIADLNKQIDSYKAQISDCNNQIASLNAEVKSLRNTASQSSNESSSELASSKQMVANLTAQLAECQKQSTKCQNDAKAAQERIAALERQVSNKNTADKNNNAELEAAIAKCNKDNEKLQEMVDNLNSQVSALKRGESGSKGTIDELNAQVASQRAEIEQLKKEIQQRNAELAEALKAKENASNQQMGNTGKTGAGKVSEKIAELQAMCARYEEEIAQLKAENSQLKSENAELREKVASSADLFAENERLQQKVKLASVLVTSDLKVTPGKSVKVGNVVKPTTKASQTKVIRIDCKIIDNNVIDPGTVAIYARIANAANRVVCNGNPENYSFDMNGTPMQYTAKQEIEFTGYGRNITMMWKKAESVELAPGLYWVTLYANGYEIGKVSFKLD